MKIKKPKWLIDVLHDFKYGIIWPGLKRPTLFDPRRHRARAGEFFTVRRNMIVYKDVYEYPSTHKTIRLMIPRGAVIFVGWEHRAARSGEMVNVVKMRATHALSLADGVSVHTCSFKYQKNQWVFPDCFDTRALECSNGIHFFLTKEEADAY